MAVYKCKMCGGQLEVSGKETVLTCEYCGTKQTLLRLDDDKKANLYDRANHFRRNNDYDKAMAIYEQLLNEDKTDAEAYWSLVLCRYGIEYVEDPASHKRIPTVNRAQFTSIFDDEDYKSALQYADGYQKSIYEEEANAINEIQKGILAISQKEEPFDVFICYKETDASGRRTQDSVLATELYHELTREGFKVFFSRITLEDKLGTAYEPYIFAALNSSKVMVALGTKPEYFNAVWVKNEWSRYLALIKNGAKKMLIPAYRDMDPYDLPEEFSHLQAQDMSKLGFMQDLIRGIKKIIEADAPKATVKETVVVNNAPAQAPAGNIAPLLERAFMFLEDGNWEEADSYCEKVLDQDPKNAKAYLGKLMAHLKVEKQTELKDCQTPFDDNKNFEKAVRFGDDSLKAELNGYIKFINERNENERKTGIYNNAVNAMKKADSEDDYKDAAGLFKSISGFKDADRLAKECLEKSDEIKRKAEELYQMLVKALKDKKNGLLSTEEKLSAKEKEKESKIKAITEKIASFEENTKKIDKLQSKFEALKTELVKKNELKAQTEEKRAELESQLSSLGLFAGSKKKELRAQIAEIDEALSEFNAEIEKIESEKETMLKEIAALGGSVFEIEAEIQKSKSELSDTEIKFDREISELESQLEEEKTSGKRQLSINELVERIVNNQFVFNYIKSKKYIPLRICERLQLPFVFGSYPQGKNRAVKPIEWTVLTKKKGQALVISKYALDCQGYNTSLTDVTWESCSLRKWMNGTFLKKAFSAEEQAQIQNTTVSADKNPEYSTNPGNATKDKVFLLSITEAKKYFTTDESRKCAPTAYAKAQGARTSDSEKTASGEATCWWWLRSPGAHQDYAAHVRSDGSVSYYGDRVRYDFVCVRPALWINLDS